MVDDLGECAQSDVRRDGAAPLGEQWPHFTDRTRNGGAVHAEPAGQHVARRCMTEMHERGQQAVDEDHLALGPGTDGPATRA
jgi:hypothetical protein